MAEPEPTTPNPFQQFRSWVFRQWLQVRSPSTSVQLIILKNTAELIIGIFLIQTKPQTKNALASA
jgi:hypothetical protein